MLTITKKQKEYLKKIFPQIRIVVLNRQKSGRKRYLVQDDNAVRSALKHYENEFLKTLWRLPAEDKIRRKKRRPAAAR